MIEWHGKEMREYVKKNQLAINQAGIPLIFTEKFCEIMKRKKSVAQN